MKNQRSFLSALIRPALAWLQPLADRRPSFQPRLRYVLLVAMSIFVVCSSARATASQHEAADFLYRLAQEYRQSGRFDDAMHELRKALILDPDHAKAREVLVQLEAEATKRQQAIDEALTRMTRQTPAAETPTTAPVTSNRWFSTKPVRLPDPSVNSVRWFYVFGKQGNPDYGALTEPQEIYIQVPKSSHEPVSLRVLDADTRGRYDEMDGDWNTSTAFRLFGGRRLLDEQVVGPDAPDGTTLTFGPYALEQGEVQGDDVWFRLEAEGLDGNDNNLFAVEVHPSSAQCFSTNPAIRLAEESGARMQFFPAIPEGLQQIVIEHNYDLDPDGGRILLIPFTKEGKVARAIPIRPSGSGVWATTEVSVPPNTDGTRWIYQITKGTQRKANMSFRMTDPHGRPLPIYLTRGQSGARLEVPPLSAPVVSAPPLSCNAFEFDASESYDPDRGTLSYFWDFGDGTTAEGMRVQHTYVQAGTYKVTLKVKDDSSTTCCVAQTEQVLPVNLPPKAVLEAPEKVCAGSAVHLSGAKSSDSPGETLRYHWDFGDGITGDGVEVTHVYVKGGAYPVTLTVDDGRATPCSQDRAVTVIHVNSLPVVHVPEAIRMCAAHPADSLEVTLSAAGSRDPDHDPLSYAWDFGDGTHGTGETVTHIYQRGGHYTAIVTADDGSGTACSSAIGIVPVYLNHPPVASAGPPAKGCPGEAVTFNANGSSDADGNPLTFHWDFGDGVTGEGAMVQHTYPSPGMFTATVTVNDGTGMACSISTARVSTVINAPPVARMTIRGAHGEVLRSPVDTASRRGIQASGQ